MVSRMDRVSKKIKHFSVNACLAPVVSMHGMIFYADFFYVGNFLSSGMAVTTVEGIGDAKGRLHAVQERLANSHGSQCGFCTPGIVMSMYTLLRNNPLPSMTEVETYFQGNLCRCTGYRPILEGFKTLTDRWSMTSSDSPGSARVKGCGAENCCKNQPKVEGYTSVDHESEDFVPYKPSQEPIFPPELQLNHSLDTEFLTFSNDRVIWYRPTTLSQLLELKSRHPEAKIVVGNTELGVEVKFKHCEYPVFISPPHIPEMTGIRVVEDGVFFGASVSLDSLEETCSALELSHEAWKLGVFRQIKEMLRWFAGKQIRNVAAVGGNIMTGSPISDLNPIFMAAGCQLEVGSVRGKISLAFDENFYTGYRRNVVKADEILLSIKIPFTKKNQHFVAYKQSKRRDDDIAIVNAAFNLTLDGKKVENIKMAFGGMAPTTKLGLKSGQALLGETFDRNIVDTATKELLSEFQLPADVPGSMVRYRQSLVVSFFFKFFLTVVKEVDGNIDQSEKSATEVFTKEPITSNQLYEKKESSSQKDVVGKPMKHKAADKQVAGSAVYLDDIPKVEGELYLGLVISSKAHARIRNVDISGAMAVEGVVDWLDHNSLSKEQNQFALAIRRDELLFAEDEVFHVGMIIGAVVAKDQDTAQHAARLVNIDYEELPAIITIDQAIEAGSFHDIPNTKIETGDVDEVLSTWDKNLIVEGSIRTGAQEHFYLETHATLAIPTGEDGEMKIFASTQNPTGTQDVVASVLGVDANKVVVNVKRMGGGFGGKESRSIPLSAVVALAASKTGKPVRMMLDRDEDMTITGHRHPFKGKYRVAFDKDGMIQAADVELFNNAGWTMDLSFAVIECALFRSTNSYNVPHMRVQGRCCKTNLPSNTAFRGFGGPQGMVVVEEWIEKIAWRLGLEPEDIKRRNLYQENMMTHFNQRLVNCNVGKCWDECLKLSDYEQMKLNIEEFNKVNRWKKQGIAMVPVKFCIGYTADQVHLNQSGAFINVYTDGSVLLTHGGTEMGQGLHTKMIQVISIHSKNVFF